MTETVKNIWEGFPGNMGNAIGGAGGWGPVLAGTALGYVAGNGGFGNNNRNNGGDAPAAPAPAPGVTQDQLATQLAALQGQLQRDQLSSQIGGIETSIAGIQAGVDSSIAGAVTSLGGAIGGVKDAVNANGQATAMALCNLGHGMQQGFAALGTAVANEGAATRSRIDQLEIGNLRDKNVELAAQVAKMGNDAGHTATQVLIQNTANANALAQAQSQAACCNPCSNGGNGGASAAIAELKATVSQLAQAVFTIHGDVAKIRGTVAP